MHEKPCILILENVCKTRCSTLQSTYAERYLSCLMEDSRLMATIPGFGHLLCVPGPVERTCIRNAGGSGICFAAQRKESGIWMRIKI